ncbi:DUF4145 domain-containing protein [Streptomyces mirabilis]|uniref:DUF4145 domain-containing protein n=1 Tax=Streptomyces mirabilis TaxID=68239 RepID=UPI003686ACD1
MSEEPVVIQCHICDRPTLATLRGSWNIIPEGDEDFDPIGYLLVSCDRCRSAQLLEQEADHGQDGDLLERIWPEDANGKSLSSSIPHAVSREMREAHACFKAKLYTATAVMVRRTLEGMCADQGVDRKRPLFKGLEELRDAGKIEGRLFDWAQALRVIGNQGAHFSTESVGREDAEDSLALAEAILDYIYVFTAKYEEFQKRRAVKATKPPNRAA